MRKERKPNTQECAYFGRKLSNIDCSDIQIDYGDICIGSDNDDQIYFKDNSGQDKRMLKERVKLFILSEPENGSQGHSIEIDLEDILTFAAKYCNGIYKRVLKENSK